MILGNNGLISGAGKNTKGVNLQQFDGEGFMGSQGGMVEMLRTREEDRKIGDIINWICQSLMEMIPMDGF